MNMHRDSIPLSGKRFHIASHCGLLLLLVCAAVLTASAQVSILTQHYDNNRTGQNINETILTPLNVNSTQFGRLFTQPIDDQAYAQPLYVPDLAIGNETHNVIFVATESDSVYAFDADSKVGANANPLWKASLIDTAHGASSGAMPVTSTQVGCTDIQPNIGITSTPVIDPTRSHLINASGG